MSKEHVQIVKMSTSILDYFAMETDLDNETRRDAIMEEFIKNLTLSLNCGTAKKEIRWIQHPSGRKYKFAEE